MKYYLYTRNTTDQEPNFFLLAKSEGIQTTLKDIQAFISSRTKEQQLKESRHTKLSQSNIVSYNPFNRL
jgi:hypothetical protein